MVWWVALGVVALSLLALLAVLATLRGRLVALARVVLAVERAARVRQPPASAAALQENLARIRARSQTLQRRLAHQQAGRPAVAGRGRPGPGTAPPAAAGGPDVG